MAVDSPWTRRTLGGLVVLVALFLFIPLGVVVLFSFQSSPSLSLPFHGFSLHWYQAALDDSDLVSALVRSLVIALLTAASTVVFGTLAAYGLSRAVRGRLRTLIGGLFFLPITIPGVFIGLALASTFAKIGIQPSLWTVLIAHFVWAFPVFLIVVLLALDRFDPALEEAAADLGASRFQTFRKVLLPLVWPILAGAAAFSFMISFDEFVITYFVVGAQPTLPVYIFGLLHRTINPTVNVIASLLLFVSLLGVVAAALLTLRGLRRERLTAAAEGADG